MADWMSSCLHGLLFGLLLDLRGSVRNLDRLDFSAGSRNSARRHCSTKIVEYLHSHAKGPQSRGKSELQFLMAFSRAGYSPGLTLHSTEVIQLKEKKQQEVGLNLGLVRDEVHRKV
jgi:hypothetical protein